jgi:hypothetical protein
MIQIVYISTARRPLSDNELESVLATSRRNNQAAQISGLLVAGGRRFLQALEGPDEAVAATFERIKADPRHFAVVPLSIKHVEAREFGAWSMAFERGGSGRAADLKSSVEALIAPLADKNLRAQFIGFSEINARAA